MSAVEQFMQLHRGFDEAFGTGNGAWVKRAPTTADFTDHLAGRPPGIGVAPLMRDGTVWFAAIDLDEPDFEAAKEMQEFIPGTSWIERSRSGNAHVLVYFKEPIEAWVVRGILKEACLAADKAGVEVFPKQDAWHDHIKYGSYINLSYHGDQRPVLNGIDPNQPPYDLDTFIAKASADVNAPEDWRKRARWLLIEPPEARERVGKVFGEGKELHTCAEHIIAQRDENPVLEGHRAAVYFSLSKMLANYEGFDDDEAMHMLTLVNDSSPDPVPASELRRIYGNARRGQFTSTGCDDPLVQPYARPDCPIAKGR